MQSGSELITQHSTVFGEVIGWYNTQNMEHNILEHNIPGIVNYSEKCNKDNPSIVWISKSKRNFLCIWWRSNGLNIPWRSLYMGIWNTKILSLMETIWNLHFIKMSVYGIIISMIVIKYQEKVLLLRAIYSFRDHNESAQGKQLQ